MLSGVFIPWSDRLTSLLRKCLPDSPFWITIICQSSLHLKQSHKCFYARQSWYFSLRLKCFAHSSQLVTQYNRKMCTQKYRDLIKLIIYVVSSRTFSGETDFRGCCALHVSVREEKHSTETAQGHCLYPHEVPIVLLTLFLHHQRIWGCFFPPTSNVNVNTLQKANHILVLL